MATTVKIRRGGGMLDSEIVEIQQTVDDAMTAVNGALLQKERFVSFTSADGKEFTVVAEDIEDIRDA
jgi:hypothetical protein